MYIYKMNVISYSYTAPQAYVLVTKAMQYYQWILGADLVVKDLCI